MIGSIVANSASAGRTFDELIADIHARAETLNGPQSMTVPVVAPPHTTLAELTRISAVGLGPTFKEVADYYFHEVIKIRYSVHSVRSVKSALNRHMYPVFADIPIKQIRRQDIRRLVTEVLKKPNIRFYGRPGCPGRANTVYWMLHRFLGWCVEEDILEANPCYGMGDPTKYHERERVLTDDEIRWFWWASGMERFPYAAIGRLLLLTGQRRSEIANLEKTQIDREARMFSIPILATKSRRAHLVPLTDSALDILDSVPWIPGRPLLFTWDGTTPLSKAAFYHANRRIHARMIEFCRAEKLRDGRTQDEVSVPWFTFHDLRRTAATVMAKLKAPIEVVDRLLNHSGGKTGTGRTVNSVTRIYVRYEYLDERRAALQALADHVKTLVGV